MSLTLRLCTPRYLGRLVTITQGCWRRGSTSSNCVGLVVPPGVLFMESLGFLATLFKITFSSVNIMFFPVFCMTHCLTFDHKCWAVLHSHLTWTTVSSTSVLQKVQYSLSTSLILKSRLFVSIAIQQPVLETSQFSAWSYLFNVFEKVTKTGVQIQPDLRCYHYWSSG